MPAFHFSLLQTKPKYACSISLWQKQWIISLTLLNRVAVVLTKIVINNCLLKNTFISLSLVAKKQRPTNLRHVCVYPATLLSENNAIVWFMGAPWWVENHGAMAWTLCGLGPLSGPSETLSIGSFMRRIPLIWRNPKRTAANPIWDTWLAELIMAQGHCPHTGTSGSRWHTKARQLGELNAYKHASC